MGKLIYLQTTSLDGYSADKNGNFDFTTPSEEVLACVNEVLKDVGTFLFGRRNYEVMAVWDSLPLDSPSIGSNQFAKLWRATDKIVYSKTLSQVSTADTALEHNFDVEAVRKMVASSDKDLDIGGSHLAAQAILAGIVDEFHQFVAPVIIGDGMRWLPDGVQMNLKLIDEHRYKNGVIHLHYRRHN